MGGPVQNTCNSSVYENINLFMKENEVLFLLQNVIILNHLVLFGYYKIILQFNQG